jgi:hypothetical protein
MIYIVKGGKEMREVTIDMDRLYDALLDHFGSMRVIGPCMEMLSNGALGNIETMYEAGNYQGLIQLAQNEGFDLEAFQV